MEWLDSPLFQINIFLFAFDSYLFRWQRIALMFWRRLPDLERASIHNHMLLVPTWQVVIHWPLVIAKWVAWAILWFYIPWYVPIGFFILSFVLIAIHSITVSPTEHHDYFIRKLAELKLMF